MPSFSHEKKLKFIITLGGSYFSAQAQNDQVIIENLRASVQVSKAGGGFSSSANIQIFGLNENAMQQCLTIAYRQNLITPNKIDIYAVDGDSESLVFTGDFVYAWTNYNAMPDVSLNIQAISAYSAQISLSNPISFKGNFSVQDAIKQISTRMGYGFENNAVDVILSNVTLANSSVEQLRRLAKMANISLLIDFNTVIISPIGVPRGTNTPLISAKTGLIGAPIPTIQGIVFRSVFNPSLSVNGSIYMESRVISTTGNWIIWSIDYNLDTMTPNGAWFLDCAAGPVSLYAKQV